MQTDKSAVSCKRRAAARSHATLYGYDTFWRKGANVHGVDGSRAPVLWCFMIVDVEHEAVRCLFPRKIGWKNESEGPSNFSVGCLLDQAIYDWTKQFLRRVLTGSAYLPHSFVLTLSMRD